jgi:glycosyltransferase involved in cell wall biosynthesis
VTEGSCKVLMVVQNAFFSDSRVLRIAGSIASRGLSVTLLALDSPGLPERERVAGFDVRRLRLRSRAFKGRLSLPLKAAEYFGKVLSACVRSGARLYHVHDPLPLAPAIVASWFTGAKVVYDVHELHFALPRVGRAQNLVTRLYESVAVRGVDRVIMSDGASRTALFRNAHRYTKPIEYVYNCPVPVEYPSPVNDLRSALGIAERAPLVVFTGNVGYDRALDRIVAGIPRWPQDAHFVMLGRVSDAAADWLPALARKIGVADRVHFYGPVPPHDVARWVMSADVASTLVEDVGASYFNSAPTKMFEAIMARLPQVASAFPEIRRVVRDNPVGPVGEIVDPADTEAIASALSRLLSDARLRNEYRLNADQLARTFFNWGVEEVKLFGVYDTVAPGLLPRARGDA